MTCEYCSLKCIASDCECICHDEDRAEWVAKQSLDDLKTGRYRKVAG